MRAIGSRLEYMALAAAFFASLTSNQLRAQPVAEFYRGKTVIIVVGSEAGGGYDLTARVLARHMAAHIPGNPTIIVQNKPGASSMIAANYVYELAPKDGTII